MSGLLFIKLVSVKTRSHVHVWSRHCFSVWAHWVSGWTCSESIRAKFTLYTGAAAAEILNTVWRPGKQREPIERWLIRKPSCSTSGESSSLPDVLPFLKSWKSCTTYRGKNWPFCNISEPHRRVVCFVFRFHYINKKQINKQKTNEISLLLYTFVIVYSQCEWVRISDLRFKLDNYYDSKEIFD